MSLTTGSRIGPYEISAQIGVGGMGEVDRAVDANLGRSVAIKVLPDALALDADRMARFEREAKTLASLNHPNIAGTGSRRTISLVWHGEVPDHLGLLHVRSWRGPRTPAMALARTL